MRSPHPRSRKRATLAALVTATALVVMAACSSSAGGGNSEGQTEGDPVVILSVADTVPGYDAAGQFEAGLAAAEGYINNKLGGFGGRPLHIERCDPKGDPAATAACARRGLEMDPVAMFGLSFFWSSSGFDLFKQAGVPTFAAVDAPVLSQDPWNVLLNSSISGEWTMQGTYACDKDVTKISVVYNDDGTFDTYKPAIEILEACGAEVEMVFLDPQQADLGVAAARAAEGNPDMIIINAGSARVAILLNELQQIGYDSSKVLLNGGMLDQDVLDDIGDAAEGVAITAQYDAWSTDAPEGGIYRQAITDYAGGDSGERSLSVWAFSQMLAIWAAAERIGFDNFSAETLAAFFADPEQYLGLPIMFGNPLTEPPADFPAIRQPTTKVFVYQDGTLVDALDGEWINTLQ